MTLTDYIKAVPIVRDIFNAIIRLVSPPTEATFYNASAMPIARYRFKGVIWLIRQRERAVGHEGEPLSDDEITIQDDPYCPECNTQLEEKWIWWRRKYKWGCIENECGFNCVADSFNKEGFRALKSARSHRDKWILL